MNEKQETGGQDSWNVALHDRYIRDLSFENPGAPATPDRNDLRFDVSVQVDSRQRDDLHEVLLTVEATAFHGTAIVFIVELSYAGLFELTGLDEEPRQRFLFCEAPRILFPWVDRIVADLTRDGGLPQMNLSPPDFAALYERQRTGAQEARP